MRDLEILTGTVREVSEMSRYIDADEFLTNESEAYMNAQIKLAKENADKTIDAGRYINLLVHKKIQMLIADTPHINLDDYVPKDFHDKTCEAMAKAHQEEIADMVSVVRCKECRHWIGETEYYEDREYKACWQLCGQYMNSEFWCKYGEREGE